MASSSARASGSRKSAVGAGILSEAYLYAEFAV